LFDVFDRSFRDFSLEYEPVAAGFHRLRIRTNQSLRKLLCYAALVALINAIQNREMRFVPDDLLVKYAKFIQYLDAPDFVRYIFKAYLIRREAVFAMVRQYLETDTIKLFFGNNFSQRMQFVRRNIAGQSIIDVGCGEGRYFRFAEKVDKYYAIDRNEQCREQCRRRIEKTGLTNVELFESLDDLPPIDGRKTLLLTEVIEHNTPEEAFALVRRCLLPETRILVTTPNRDFNVFYKHDDAEEDEEEETDFRHEGHVFEFSDQEFREFITKAIEGSGGTVQFFNLGDCVDGITPQSATIVDVP
jgi:SAM-dependent methyltransferase